MDTKGQYNAADITWVIVSAALVFDDPRPLNFFSMSMVLGRAMIPIRSERLAAAGVYVNCCVGDSWLQPLFWSPAWVAPVSSAIPLHIFLQGVASGEPGGTIPRSSLPYFQLCCSPSSLRSLVVGAVAERITSRPIFFSSHCSACWYMLLLPTGPGTRASSLRWACLTLPEVP